MPVPYKGFRLRFDSAGSATEPATGIYTARCTMCPRKVTAFSTFPKSLAALAFAFVLHFISAYYGTYVSAFSSKWSLSGFE
jgi:hypothetical protein